MSQNQQTPQTRKPQSDDPLASLHRMSTTAGVASQEYVAINQTAIATLLLGLAAISVVMSNTLLVLPIVAIACGIVALRQIGNSNGTQTGKLLALLGMALSLVMSAVAIVPQVKEHIALRAEEGRIIAAVNEFGQAMVAKDYDRAVSSLDPVFFTKKKLTKEAFIARWNALVTNEFYGDLTSVASNGRVGLEGDTAQGHSGATLLVCRFSKTDTPLRSNASLKKDDTGQWKIDDMPELFPTPPDLAASGGPQGGAPR